MTHSKPIAIDLFCGAGGFSEGILQAGFHIAFSNDINKDVEKTYVHRHHQLGLIQGVNTHFERMDIRNLTGKFIMDKISDLSIFKDRLEVDVIFGGPPCQGFSRAGKRKQDDPRNMLFKEYLRVVSELTPKYVVMENVEGFMDSKLPQFVGLHGNEYASDEVVPNILISEFAILGYDTLQPKLLDASDYGVPQRRKRAIFIAYKRGLPAPTYPEPISQANNKVAVLQAIGDLIKNPDLKQQLNPTYTQYQLDSINGRTMCISGQAVVYDRQIKNHEFSSHYPYITERFSLYREGENTSNLRKRVLQEGICLEDKNNLVDIVCKSLNGTYSFIEVKSAFNNAIVNEELVQALLTKKNNRLRLHRDEVAATVLTLPDDYISPFEDRIFSVRELARLQSFDDSFEFLGKRTTGGDRRKDEVPQYTQVGNAVPPLLARAIANEIRKALKKSI